MTEQEIKPVPMMEDLFNLLNNMVMPPFQSDLCEVVRCVEKYREKVATYNTATHAVVEKGELEALRAISDGVSIF